MWAWKSFGGRSLEQAYSVFVENPEGHTEDFSSMGDEAFEYYFPVIDRYLREVEPVGEDDDLLAGHLGWAVASRLKDRRNQLPESLVGEIGELAGYVLENVERLAGPGKWRRRIGREWERVRVLLER